LIEKKEGRLSQQRSLSEGEGRRGVSFFNNTAKKGKRRPASSAPSSHERGKMKGEILQHRLFQRKKRKGRLQCLSETGIEEKGRGERKGVGSVSFFCRGGGRGRKERGEEKSRTKPSTATGGIEKKKKGGGERP